MKTLLEQIAVALGLMVLLYLVADVPRSPLPVLGILLIGVGLCARARAAACAAAVRETSASAGRRMRE